MFRTHRFSGSIIEGSKFSMPSAEPRRKVSPRFPAGEHSFEFNIFLVNICPEPVLAKLPREGFQRETATQKRPCVCSAPISEAIDAAP
jgi:hypothetical protein